MYQRNFEIDMNDRLAVEHYVAQRLRRLDIKRLMAAAINKAAIRLRRKKYPYRFEHELSDEER